MIRKKIKLALLCLAFANASAFAQSPRHFNVPVAQDGAVFVSLASQKIPVTDWTATLPQMLGLSEDFSFKLLKENTDNKGRTHRSYEQYYRGIPVSSARIIVHSQNGKLLSITGKIMPQQSQQITTVPSFYEDKALEKAAADMQLQTLLRHEVIQQIYFDSETATATLAFKVDVDGWNQANKFLKYTLYIDAHSGQTLKKYSRIALTDVEATAETYYSGTQTISTEEVTEGVYRLRDNSRNITTYDVSGQIPNFMGSPLFDAPNEVTNNSTNWLAKPHIMGLSLNSVTDEAIHTGLGLSFLTFSGNVLASEIQKDSDLSTLSRNNELGLAAEFTLPYYTNNLFVAVDDTETYTGRFFKDSVALDLFAGTLASVAVDEESSATFSINTDELGSFDWIDSKGNTGTYTIAETAHPVVDVHWGISRTWDYFNENFDYQSFDGEGGLILNYYNGTAMYVGTQNNAAALPAPENAMVYGTGDGIDFNPFVSLDVTAHEFTHLITSNTSNLEYTGESGALNESFSDIMGAAIEFYAKPETANWEIGEEMGITLPFLRSMSNPNAPADFSSAMAMPQPDTYLGTYWAPTGSSDPDNGGVHINSGVGNYWFYLLSVGGSGTNDNGDAYNVSGLGIDLAADIVFHTFTQYLTPTSNYHDAYHATRTYVIDNYGEDSDEYLALVAAWHAVGIPSTTNIPTGPTTTTEINIYPNPVQGNLHINNPSDKSLHAKLIDIKGRVVEEWTIQQGANIQPTAQLAPGTYTLVFDDGQQQIAQKLVVLSQ